MKVSSISGIYGSYPIHKNYYAKNPQRISQVQQKSPSFQGNAGKIIGGIAGFIAITAICPAITMMGLGGLGVIGGLAAGNAIDEKIEEKQEEKNKKQ